MQSTTSFLILVVLIALSAAKPKAKPQFYPLFHGPPPAPVVHHGVNVNYNRRDSQAWPQTQQNFTNPQHEFLDPLSDPDAQKLLRSGIPRQIPPQQNLGYPQIYKFENLIIIANPVQAQPQPCIPQYQPARPIDDDLLNRIPGEEPSKCTWAIVACCSPGSNNIRYNCFDLFGCTGSFFDNSPCDLKFVEAAAKAALQYYSSANNATSAPNRV